MEKKKLASTVNQEIWFVAFNIDLYTAFKCIQLEKEDYEHRICQFLIASALSQSYKHSATGSGNKLPGKVCIRSHQIWLT